MAAKHEITAADLLPSSEYAARRSEERRKMVELKRRRRIDVGPYATFYFECFATMRHQVQEMLYIEKGGEEQLKGELAAYNPLVPNGRELVATLMIEIDEPARRQEALERLGGIENKASLKLAGKTVKGVAEEDAERTTPEGKASSVQFIHFPLTREEVALFKTPGSEIVLALEHPAYGHMARISEEARAELAKDLD